MRQSDDPDTFELTEPDPDHFVGEWSWNSRTDGGVIGELAGDSWRITIQPNGYGGPEPLLELRAYDRSGSSIPLGLGTGTSSTIVLSPTYAPPAPGLAPIAIGMLTASLAFAGVRAARRRPR